MLIPVLKLLAALWAAESIDEKKPELGLAGTSEPSIGGVRGLAASLERRLGTMVAEAEVLRLWVEPRDREGGVPSAGEDVFQVDAPSSPADGRVGVGGVLTMAGDEVPMAGGRVRGSTLDFGRVARPRSV